MRICSISSGSNGNCIFVGSERNSILIDAGISGKKIEEGLNSFSMTSKDLDGIFITHEHIDHVKGAGVMARRYHLPIYATAGTILQMKKMTSLGEIPKELFHEITEEEKLSLGELQIEPFSISHDAAQPVAYKMHQGEKTMAVATDMGNYDEKTIRMLQGLDVLLLEANHDVHMLEVGKYPYYLKRRILGDSGHLSNETAGRLLCEVLHDDLRAVFLGHLSHENNYEALAYETVCAEVTMGDNPYKASDFKISVAHRDRVSEYLEI